MPKVGEEILVGKGRRFRVLDARGCSAASTRSMMMLPSRPRRPDRPAPLSSPSYEKTMSRSSCHAYFVNSTTGRVGEGAQLRGAVVPFEEEDESPFVGLLRVEGA